MYIIWYQRSPWTRFWTSLIILTTLWFLLNVPIFQYCYSTKKYGTFRFNRNHRVCYKQEKCRVIKTCQQLLWPDLHNNLKYFRWFIFWQNIKHRHRPKVIHKVVYAGAALKGLRLLLTTCFSNKFSLFQL